MKYVNAVTSAILFMMLFAFINTQAQTTDVAKGKMLYEKNMCERCHGKDGKAPFNLTARLDSLSDGHLLKFIKDPGAFGNRQMPAFKALMPDEEISTVITYIRTLGAATTDRKKKTGRSN